MILLLYDIYLFAIINSIVFVVVDCNTAIFLTPLQNVILNKIGTIIQF